MSRLNKSAESVMIGYVVLIAIAVSLSTGVFIYLKLYLPSDKPECYQDIDLIIDSATCQKIVSTGMFDVHIEFTNKGLFSIDSAYIKIGDADRVFKTTLNDAELNRMASSCNNNELNLKPGAKFCKTYTYAYSTPSIPVQEISVEPLLWIENVPVLCPNSIVTKKINCV